MGSGTFYAFLKGQMCDTSSNKVDDFKYCCQYSEAIQGFCE